LPVKEEDTYFRMQGRAVFAHAVNRMAESARHTAARVGWPVGEVDRWVLHQANARILAAVARTLQVPLDRFVTNIARVGNTVAASVPLALADGIASGELRPGHRVVLAAFGGGLAWGSVALVWPELLGCGCPAGLGCGCPAGLGCGCPAGLGCGCPAGTQLGCGPGGTAVAPGTRSDPPGGR
jgi:3-oxoacyl-[acyl-carrier-protein] synthase-3